MPSQSSDCIQKKIASFSFKLVTMPTNQVFIILPVKKSRGPPWANSRHLLVSSKADSTQNSLRYQTKTLGDIIVGLVSDYK